MEMKYETKKDKIVIKRLHFKYALGVFIKIITQKYSKHMEIMSRNHQTLLTDLDLKLCSV